MSYDDNIKKCSCNTDWLEQHAPKPPQPTLPPYFPTFQELCSTPSGPSERSVQSLYTTLLGGRPELLYRDSQEHPEKYDRQTTTLLSELMQTPSKELTPTDRSLLDLAVLTLHSRPSPPPTKTQTLQANKRPSLPMKVRPPVEAPEMETSGESDVVAPFWWTRS